jgi:putative flippase GtrA
VSHIEITPFKATITRAWNDLSRKLIAFLATGLTASGLLFVLNYLGITIPEALATTIVVVISSLAGYLKSEVLPTPVPVDRAE